MTVTDLTKRFGATTALDGRTTTECAETLQRPTPTRSAEVIPALVEVEMTNPPDIALIGAGSAPPNPSELLGSAAMTQTLRELESLFDVVIIDSTSVAARDRHCRGEHHGLRDLHGGRHETWSTATTWPDQCRPWPPSRFMH